MIKMLDKVYSQLPRVSLKLALFIIFPGVSVFHCSLLTMTPVTLV